MEDSSTQQSHRCLLHMRQLDTPAAALSQKCKSRSLPRLRQLLLLTDTQGERRSSQDRSDQEDTEEANSAGHGRSHRKYRAESPKGL